MNNSAEILLFEFNSTDFKQSAVSLFSESIKRLNNARISKLNKVVEELEEKPVPLIPITEIEDVVRKFKNHLKATDLFSTDFTGREVRTLTDSLFYSDKKISAIFDKTTELEIALKIINVKWRDSFLRQLIETYFKKWDNTNKESVIMLYDFICSKLKTYSGSRQPSHFFKHNLSYLNPNSGDLALGKDISKKGISISEIAKHINVSKSWISHPYFSKVFVAYYETGKKQIHNFIEELYQALIEHNNLASSKRLVSKLILQANATEFENLQDKIKSIAFKLVGDPAPISNDWESFTNATEQEKSEIKEARKVLNEWITRKFITVFFERIQEPRRKTFWNRYSDEISSVTVVGPKSIKAILKRDERISEYVDARFRVTESNRAASAFIMRMKDYVLIEFSVSNFAFYALKENHRLIKGYETRRITSVEEFVDGTMPMLAKRKFANIENENSEGRLFHRDGNFEDGSTLKWESVFDWWIKKYVDVDV